MTEKYAWENKGLDESAAKELWLYIDNDGDLYRQQYQPIIKNLVAKKARGTYDHTLAAKLFGYLVESGAKKYTKEYDSRDSKWNDIFPKKVRDAVAEELRDHFEIEYALDAYREMVPKKYQPKAPKTTYSVGSKRKSSRSSSGSQSTLGGIR